MRTELERIIELQPEWVAVKTPAMDERGILIRHSGPQWLRGFGDEIANAIGIDAEDLLIEGRDGTGMKTEVPWFRFGSKTRSPSATMDWYCVYLFDASGGAVYLTLAQGSTEWTGVDFRPRPKDELRRLAALAREQLELIYGKYFSPDVAVDLRSRRSILGEAYEAGIAAAIRYEKGKVPHEERLKEDVLSFASYLGVVYRSLANTPVLQTTPPEITEILEAAAVAAGKETYSKSGQGFRLNTVMRRNIENRAMHLARAYLEDNGWQIEDRSKNKPYDYYCTNGSEEMYVEVKGTTSLGEKVVLTRGEVEYHREVSPANSLIIVSGIELSGVDGNEANGGTLSEIHPWSIEEEDLVVIAYVYSNRLKSDRA